jgi:hypothetical protein
VLGSPGVLDGSKLRFSKLASLALLYSFPGVDGALPLAVATSSLILVFILLDYYFTSSFEVLILIFVIRGSRVARR